MGRDGTMRLRDRRQLGYRETGPAEGLPVVYLHGCPGSRLDIPDAAEETCERLGARVVAVDRPGFGLSDPLRRRRIADLAADVAQLADHLGLERFALYGLSAGGPYALACAAALGERIGHVLVVSGVGPAEAPDRELGMANGERLLYRLARRAPFLLAPGFSQGRRKALRDPDAMLADLAGDRSARDREILERPEIGARVVRTFLEATRQGGRPAAQDIRLWVRPWGIDLGAIRSPVTLVHGDEDRIAPIAGAEYVAALLPDARLVRHRGEGHLLVFARADELLELAVSGSARAT